MSRLSYLETAHEPPSEMCTSKNTDQTEVWQEKKERYLYVVAGGRACIRVFAETQDYPEDKQVLLRKGRFSLHTFSW